MVKKFGKLNSDFVVGSGELLINFHFVPDGDEDEDEIVDDDALSQPREEPASLEDLPSDQFDMPKRETSV